MKKIIITIIICILLILTKGFLIEPNTLKTNEYFITDEKIPTGFDGFKIVHFSDTVYTKDINSKKIDKLINAINKQNPDLIVFTGDFTKEKLSNSKKELLIKKFSKLNATINKIYITGDQDKDNTILDNSGFINLTNTGTPIFYKDLSPIYVNNIENSEEPCSYKIGLIHKPDDIKDYTNNDLVFAGHSEGGQVRLPFIGAIIRKKGATTYSNEFYTVGNTKLYNSFGVGTENYFRLFNEPSINVYRLNKTA